jgi:hypothetical protein
MLKEFVDAIGQQAVKAHGPHWFKPPQEPEHTYCVVLPDGKISQVDAEPKPRAHTAGDLATVAAFAIKYADGAAIWYSRYGVTCLTDDQTRRDLVSMPLSFSPQILRLVELEKNRPAIKQAEFIRLLRITFAGCLGQAGNLLEVVRKIRFTVNTGGGSEIRQGKVSIGKTLEAELSGAAALPEYVVLDVPVFEAGAMAWQFEVQCALEADAQTETFQLIPLPGCVEGALTQGEQKLASEIGRLLGDSQVPVYYGTP